MREIFGLTFKVLVLALSVLSVFWQLYEALWVGTGKWVSLGLFLYACIAIVLLMANSIALLLPGKKTIPIVSLVIITAGFLLFAFLPHQVSMF